MTRWKVGFVVGVVAIVGIVAADVWLVRMRAVPAEERSTQVKAYGRHVYGLLADSSAWARWSLLGTPDAPPKMTCDGPSVGAGASCKWKGPASEGRLTIVEAVPEERVRVKLEYEKPAGEAREATFTLKSLGAPDYYLRGPPPVPTFVVTWRLEAHLAGAWPSSSADMVAGLAGLKREAQAASQRANATK